MIKKIEGLIAAPFTPFDSKGDVNYKLVGPYASLLSRNGVAGGFICGSSGEGQSMSLEERINLAECWLKEAPKTFKVIVHAGANSLPDVKSILNHAQEKGAYAAAFHSPSYFKPGTVASLVDYCAEVSAAAPKLPLYYYHIPALSGANFPIREFLLRAADRIPNLVGVKYTNEDLMDYSECLELMDGRFDMLYGRDEMLLSALPLGAKGAVGSTFNFAAPLYLKLIEAYNVGNLKKAKELQALSHKMLRVIFGVGKAPLSAIKATMRETGIDCGAPRLPLPALDKSDMIKLSKGLEGIAFDSFRNR